MFQQENDANQQLDRSLTSRHIQLIAIGGCIGTGLFMGSGKTISLAGPSILLIYLLIGIMLFFVMRAMGELLLSNLKYKSFLDFVSELLGPMAGFFVGWTYWFCWVVIGIADLVAIAGYIKIWEPNLPAWIPALICIMLFLTINLLTVKLFGELEFWFALIKIIAIVTLIVVGAGFILTAFKAPTGEVTSLANIWNDGGFFAKGGSGFIAGFQIAVFAFVGVELVGTTAAEAKDPYKTLPKAINTIPVRIILFYVLSLVVIMSVIPWRTIDPDKSPFIILFIFAGFPAAASIIYFVVLTSAASSANSGIFSTSRMLFGLSLLTKAPKPFSSLSRAAVPANGLLFSCACLFPGVILLYFNNDHIIYVFTLVSSVATILFLFIWMLILFAYMVYRNKYPQRHITSNYKMPGGIPMCWVCIVFFIFIITTLVFQSDTRQALLATPIWFIVLLISYYIVPSSVKDRWQKITQDAMNNEENI